MSLVEHEFRLLHKLQHVNLVPYMAFKCYVKQDTVNIFVVEELVKGLSVNFYVQVQVHC